MYLLTNILFLCALLTSTHASPTINLPTLNTTLSILNTTLTTPPWTPGTCRATISLRQLCTHDFTSTTYITTFAQFTLVDSRGAGIPSLSGRGVFEPYPANEIDVAHIQGPSFALSWKWYEGETSDKMTFRYDWGDVSRSEDDETCFNRKVWSEGREGTGSKWWKGCLEGRVRAGTERTRVSTCPFECSYKPKD